METLSNVPEEYSTLETKQDQDDRESEEKTENPEAEKVDGVEEQETDVHPAVAEVIGNMLPEEDIPVVQSLLTVGAIPGMERALSGLETEATLDWYKIVELAQKAMYQIERFVGLAKGLDAEDMAAGGLGFAVGVAAGAKLQEIMFGKGNQSTGASVLAGAAGAYIGITAKRMFL